MTDTSRPRAERDAERLTRVAMLAERRAAAVPELLAELVAPSWAVRRAVVATLAQSDLDGVAMLVGALRSTRANEATIAGIVDALSLAQADLTSALLPLLDDPNPAVVCDGAQILGRRASAAALPQLGQLTQHADDNVALAAIEALGRIGGRQALDCLLAVADTRHFFRTFPAIDALGRSGDARALDVLVKLAAEPLYGVEAVRAIGRLADAAALNALVNVLSDADETLVRAVAQALFSIQERSQRKFGTSRAVEYVLTHAANLPKLRRQFEAALSGADTIEQVALTTLLALLGDEDTANSLLKLLDGAASVATAAQAALRHLGAIAEPLVIEALSGARGAERRLLIPILSGRTAAQTALVACLADPDPVVRAQACDALARTSDPAVVPALSALLSDPDARAAQAALAAIQSLGSPEAESAALTAAASSDSRTRVAGLRMLGYFAYPSGLQLLCAATHSEDDRVREAALGSLPYLEHPDADAALLACSRHDSARTRAAAIRALGHGAVSEATRERVRAALSDPDAWVRYYACQALGHLRDDSSADALAGLLHDPFGQVRVAAVEGLAHLRGAHAFALLTGLLGSTDLDLYRAALVALGITKREEAVPHLLRAFAAPEAATRLVALAALAEHDAPLVIETLARATDDADEGVRASAASFLAARSERTATSELLRLIAKSPTRESLIQALSRPTAGRLTAIEAALATADDPLAGGLVAALARNASDAAIATIRATLLSPNAAARRAAAAALVARVDGASANSLRQAAFSDDDPEVRRIAASSLASPAVNEP